VNSCDTNNGGCGAHQGCKSTGAGTNTCECLSNWRGEPNWEALNCGQCSSGYWGAECTACPVCVGRWTCDDGVSGSGQCPIDCMATPDDPACIIPFCDLYPEDLSCIDCSLTPLAPQCDPGGGNM
jgi:hypothetical protein